MLEEKRQASPLQRVTKTGGSNGSAAVLCALPDGRATAPRWERGRLVRIAALALAAFSACYCSWFDLCAGDPPADAGGTDKPFLTVGLLPRAGSADVSSASLLSPWLPSLPATAYGLTCAPDPPADAGGTDKPFPNGQAFKAGLVSFFLPTRRDKLRQALRPF